MANGFVGWGYSMKTSDESCGQATLRIAKSNDGGWVGVVILIGKIVDV